MLQIVFPEAHWIGTKEDNPAEKQLPMPAELCNAVQHQKYSFAADASQPGTAEQCNMRAQTSVVLHASAMNWSAEPILFSEPAVVSGHSLTCAT